MNNYLVFVTCHHSIYGVMAGVFTFSHFGFTLLRRHLLWNRQHSPDVRLPCRLPRNVTAVFNFTSCVSWWTRPPSDCAPVCTNCAYISSALFPSIDRRLLFAGRQRSVYRLSSSFSFSAVLVAMLLLLGGVKPNPGPAGIRFGLVNSRSAITKAALIHDTISHHCLEVLVVTETWMHADLPPAVVDDSAPPDYAVIHRYRPSGQGGGVAIVHRRGLKVSTLTITAECRVFECLTVKLSTAGRRLNLGAFNDLRLPLPSVCLWESSAPNFSTSSMSF